MNLTPEEFASIRKKNEQNAKNKKVADNRLAQMSQLKANNEATYQGFVALINFINGHTTKTEVLNQIKSVSTPDVEKLVGPLSELLTATKANNLDISPLTTVMGEVVSELKLLPKEHPDAPEAPEDVKINNFDELTKEFTRVVDAFQGMKLVIPAPEVKVNVPKQKIETQTIDLKPLTDVMNQMLAAFQETEYPEVEFDTSKLEEKLDNANRILKKLLDKPSGGGGGGGGHGTPYITSTGAHQYVTLNPDGSIPVTATIDTTNYTTRIEEDSGDSNLTYIGNAVIGSAEASAVWQIKRLDATTGLVKLWADGADAFDQVWDNRESLSYT